MNDSALDPATLLIDGVRPAAVLAPASVDEIADILRDASSRNLAVCPVGGGTQLACGNPPERCDVALLTSGLGSILEYRAEDLTVTVQCGTRLREVQETLAERGQFLPLTSPSVASTIGGVLACDTPGPYRSRFGGPRDLLLGAAWVRPDGETVHAGGKVVKNVSGYDLHRLQVGALGTLGVLVEATFKVSPLPRATATYRLHSPGYAQAWSWADSIIRSSFRYLVLDVVGVAGGPWEVVVVIEGGSAVQQRAEGWLSTLADAYVAPDDSAAAFRLRNGSDNEAVLRASLPPAAMSALAEKLPARARLASQPAVGLMLIALAEAGADDVRQLRSAAGEAGGHLNILSAPPALEAEVPPFDDPGPSLALMRRLRETYDPRRVLNPGRFLVGI